MNLGANNVAAMYLGSTAITSAYLGTVQVFGGNAFTITDLFANSENGTWLEHKDLTTMFTDTAGTTNVTTDGDAVARVNDKSGNGRNALQATTAQQPPYQITPDRLVYDGVDDNMVVDFGSAFAGDVFQGTVNGILHYAISTAGTWKNPQDARYLPDGGTVTATIAREGTLPAGDVAKVKTYLQEETGSGTDFAGVTSMANWFRGRTDITAIYWGDWNTAAVTDFGSTCRDCNSLVSFPLIDTSSGTGFYATWFNCSSLTNFPANFFDGCAATNFGFAFTYTALSEVSIDGILVSIESNGTSGGTFDQSGGSAPSATGEAAVTALRDRGWTVTVTGGFEAVDPDAATYISAVETADGEALEAAVQTAINDFVVGCKDDATWDALKASCILAGARTLNGCLVPLAGTAPTNFNFVSADYDRKTGLKGDGSTKYLNSNRNNNADPQDNQHLSVWVSEHITARGSDTFYIGDNVNTTGCSNIGRSTNSAASFFVQSRSNLSTSGSTLLGALDPVPTGLQAASRNVSTGFSARQGGVTISEAQPSATPSSADINVHRAGSFWGAERIAFYSIGESIDLTALDTRISDLMTALDGAIA